MAEPIDIAVVGAISAVGEALLEFLHERKFPVGRVYALGSGDAIDDDANFGNRQLDVGDVARFDFSKVRLAFFCEGAGTATDQVPRATAAGCVVIDDSGVFSGDAGVPLVVPELNGVIIGQHRARGIVASPGSAAIALALALKPLYDAAGIERVSVATYQAVSGSGKAGVEELGQQTTALLNFRDVENLVYPKQIAFNLLPQIGELDGDGHAGEELRIARELRRLFADDSLPINVTAVRVPVFYGCALALHLETTRRLAADEARALLRSAPGITVVDERGAGGWPTPVTDAVGADTVFVGRIRESLPQTHGVNLWIVVDDIRKGAALNCVQIAESLVASMA